MNPVFVIIMGVSGCGKTTVADQVAEAVGGRFLEGDAYHPPENKVKMGAGIPLTDADRWPWFDRLRTAAQETLASDLSPILACSALKQTYRDHLVEGFPSHRLVYLQGSFELIKGRMDAREHEYMTSTLLRSQFDTLEEPTAESGVLVLSIAESPESLVRTIVASLTSD